MAQVGQGSLEISGSVRCDAIRSGGRLVAALPLVAEIGGSAEIFVTVAKHEYGI